MAYAELFLAFLLTFLSLQAQSSLFLEELPVFWEGIL
jgi:hypothetical protein